MAAPAAQGQLEKALADCSKAVELKPGWSTGWYERGNVYFAAGQHDKAIADFSKAIELEPGFAWAWGNRGIAHATRGDRDLAWPTGTRPLSSTQLTFPLTSIGAAFGWKIGT